MGDVLFYTDLGSYSSDSLCFLFRPASLMNAEMKMARGERAGSECHMF